MKIRHALFGLLASILLLAGCATLDEKQREWIFQPSDRSWGNSAQDAADMADVWIDLPPVANARLASQPNASARDVPTGRLHALWAEGPAQAGPNGPVLLFLHGARWNVTASAPRIRRMQELGFSVLAIDYRGFGKSSPMLPSEESAEADALAAWQWLARKYPDRPRYIFGHSLGGAIGIDLATQVQDESGLIVEGTFTSIADVVSTFKWGWLPVGALITQRFESLRKIDKIGSPLLVVHGTDDSLILPSLGKKLYDAAVSPKRFVLVEGGSHHTTNSLGQAQYREALRALFGSQPAFQARPEEMGPPAPRLDADSGDAVRVSSQP